MTTRPKVRKFRTQPGLPVPPAPTQPAAAEGAETLFDPQDDGFGPGRFDTARAEPAAKTGAPDIAEEITRIRAEGLTGRQLRLARRVAQKHGIEASSDYEAVRLLRRKGIDPFDRSQVLKIVQSETEAVAKARAAEDAQTAEAGRVMLPTAPRSGTFLPSSDLLHEDNRAREIIRLQRDIARRRRHRLLMLFARLAFFVFLPTFLAGWYYYTIATPLYATKSEFVIQKADGMGSGGGMGGLFAGTQLGSSQDSITVQSYLQSRDAMLRLDADYGFKEHFSQDHIDMLQRLEKDASNEKAYKIYSRNVKIGYDPSEGLVKMEVIAADPEVSRTFAQALIGYAEEQVDQLTHRLREDQMKGARESYLDAEQNVLDAQKRVLELQEQLGILDPITESNVVMSQVSTLETQLQEKRLQLQQLLDNARPNAARVEGVKGDIARMESMVAGLRASLTQTNGVNTSLAAVTGQLRIAEADLETRQLMLSSSAQQLETARIEANKQVRYLEMGVRPVAPDEPTYPRAFESTLLAFLIFSGIYLMLSLTVSILREQVSS